MPAAERPGGDIGRRVAARRAQLGLSREDVALRAGSAPGYITYLEEQLATPGMGFLLRLANALETTVQELTGRNAEFPAGLGQAAHHHRMVDLDVAECWALLGEHGVGRVAATTSEGPVVLPVNYRVVGGDVLFRTGALAAPAPAEGTEIAFEADHIDEAFSRGWSVLVVGRVHALTDDAAPRRPGEPQYAEPWAEDGRDPVMVLSPRRVTGRRILARGAPGEPDAPR